MYNKTKPHKDKRMKKIKKSVLYSISVLAALSLLFLTACNTANGGQTEPPQTNIQPKNTLWYDYFDTICVAYDYSGMTNGEFEEITDFIEDELKACHELYDIYNEYSGINNLATVNKNAGGDAVKVDERIIDLLKFSKEMYDKTNGEVNVALGAVLVLWHDAREAADEDPENAKIPDMAQLAEAALHTDINSVVIDEAAGTVKITDPEARIDVGAIAKGYTTERIAKLLIDRGITSFVLDFGGNLRVIGTKPDGSGWNTGIRNPSYDSENPYARTLVLKNSSLVTSGTYERFFTVDGVRYHHIIDKDTLMPGNKYASVSIQTESSAVADALSTAVFNMTREEIDTLVSSMPDVEITIVDNEGNVTVLGSKN